MATDIQSTTADDTRTRILQAAGVNLASVNYYFRDKERLYIETVTRAAQLRAEQVPFPPWPPGTPPATKLRDFIRTLLTRMIGPDAAPWQARLMMSEILRPTAACRELVQQYMRPQLNVLLGILDEILPPGTPVHVRHQTGFSIVGQCLFYRVAKEVIAVVEPEDELQQNYRLEQLADHIG